MELMVMKFGYTGVTRGALGLNKQFKKIDWNSTLNTDSVLLDFSCFFALVKDIFDSCFPQKKIKITYSNKNPWITKVLKDEIK